MAQKPTLGIATCAEIAANYAKTTAFRWLATPRSVSFSTLCLLRRMLEHPATLTTVTTSPTIEVPNLKNPTNFANLRQIAPSNPP